ncbi:hypothetical protein HO173_012857 [Letharia columbiana]|uniref:Uncharacterized protein n=1 Tax=Letharia columbiana TaxID=112416 RepID=A0A8H6FED6_9LECA|nr:uncharacterized protein HO173_012857 [Letharia columbiana]KAF6225290.1 hypothetical protein HO173_012857 [Letharia columbiana]
MILNKNAQLRDMAFFGILEKGRINSQIGPRQIRSCGAVVKKGDGSGARFPSDTNTVKLVIQSLHPTRYMTFQ